MFVIPPGWRWRIWLVLIVVWTIALVVPIKSQSPSYDGSWYWSLRFAASKSLHVAAYAFLTMLAGWLRAPVRYRFLMMFILMAHGTVTELLQQLPITDRSGTLQDVGLDNFGILLGMVLTWRWWTQDGN